MNEQEKSEIAAFRFGLIAAVVQRDLLRRQHLNTLHSNFFRFFLILHASCPPFLGNNMSLFHMEVGRNAERVCYPKMAIHDWSDSSVQPSGAITDKRSKGLECGLWELGRNLHRKLETQ